MILTSLHSQLRWLERVNPTEPYPATAIRRAVERGDRREIGDQAQAVSDDEHGVGIILREERGVTNAVTVLVEFSEVAL